MKIALCYRRDSNFGDMIIFDATRWLLDNIFKRNGIRDVEIVPVDIALIFPQEKNAVSPASRKRRMLKKLAAICRRYVRFAWFQKLLWRMSTGYRRYEKSERGKLLDVDMILFAGGGMIKFRNQNCHFFVDDITAIAEKRGISVIMNAVGVEGYDKSDPGCRMLKKALNRKCVKAISVRDDIDTLRRKYIIRNEIDTAHVCDPAFWLKEAYGIKSHPSRRSIVGLNVIRTEIFGDYLYDVDDHAMIRLYRNLAKQLIADGYEVVFFTNGGLRDGQFIDRLLSECPDIAEDPAVSVSCPCCAAELIAIVSGFERFLAVRLHAAIVGTVLGVPHVSLVWNEKQLFFAESVSLRDNCLLKGDFSERAIRNRLLNAKPYVMDAGFKATVAETLEKNVLKWMPRKDGVPNG